MHDDLEEHWHSFDEGAEGYTSEDIDGIESFKQQSVGIDIGSSTSHLIFSELVLRRELSSGRFVVTDRRTLHRSAIFLTPYASPSEIDSIRLKGFLDRTYEAAGIGPDDIDAGAVVITGEALKKENARPILDMFAGQAGKFICASAGPNHEAILAAHGSGAVSLSLENHWRVLVVDIGGGTTKFALIENGQIRQTAAMSVGARLVATDDEGRLSRIEDAARMMQPAGATLALGDLISSGVKQSLVDRMIDSLFEVILGAAYSEFSRALLITEPLSDFRGLSDIDRIVFSGGVSEYVYDRDHVTYGDLGLLLGQAIRRRISELAIWEFIAPSGSGIRATVIGAAEYTIQASGNTSYLPNREMLPLYGLQVMKPDTSRIDDLAGAILERLTMFGLSAYGAGLVLALTLGEDLTYSYLRRVCEGIISATGMTQLSVGPLVVVIDKDVAKTIGSILKEELSLESDLVVLDGIDVGYLDYLDIGEPIGASSATSEVVPVMVKSLVFPGKPVLD